MNYDWEFLVLFRILVSARKVIKDRLPSRQHRHNVQWANDDPGHPLTANEKAFNVLKTPPPPLATNWGIGGKKRTFMLCYHWLLDWLDRGSYSACISIRVLCFSELLMVGPIIIGYPVSNTDYQEFCYVWLLSIAHNMLPSKIHVKYCELKIQSKCLKLHHVKQDQKKPTLIDYIFSRKIHKIGILDLEVYSVVYGFCPWAQRPEQISFHYAISF